MHTSILARLLIGAFFTALSPGVATGADTGSIEGTVVFAGSQKRLSGIEITLLEAQKTVISGETGEFRIEGLSAGTYTLTARGTSFQTTSLKVIVSEGTAALVAVNLPLSPLAESVVVSASPYTQNSFETYQPTTTLDGKQLEQNLSGTLGETLRDQLGVNVRSFGPATSRPVIRGFDGDRVLVMQDGNRTGDLGSQSGDHGVPIDPASLERVEVVRGPAALLYGSNAIGGVVNSVTTDVGHNAPFKGTMGHARFEGGTVNSEGAVNGHIDHGTGNWIFHAGGGGRRTSDYRSPIGKIENSDSRTENAKFGFHFVNDRTSVGFNYGYDDLSYGIPFAGAIEGEEDATIALDATRQSLQFTGHVKHVRGPFQEFRFSAGYTDYQHRELEDNVVTTVFDNRLLEYRALLDQRRTGRLSGTLGLWGLHRDYATTGAEALAPATIQNSIAVFAYEELSWEPVKFQFGGRIDHTRYRPNERRARNFTGFSGSLGLLVNLRKDTVLATNYALAYRSPALEELYNFGPHIGTVSFEIGNDSLERELGNGIDVALRHRADRVQAEFNFFYTHIRDFIFGSPTGESMDGLPVFEFTQGDSRFLGFETGVDLALREWLWLNLGCDYVSAKLTDSGQHLPRIPPLRGRAGLEFRHGGFSFMPQFIMASDQDRTFGAETRTAGYTVLNIRAAYSWDDGRLRHTLTAGLLNAGDRLYRNHLSYIKELAPEYGRSFKVTYTINFF